MWRHVASNVLTLLVVLLFLLGGVILWGKTQYTAEGPLDAAICLRVAPGETMRGVSRDLGAEGAVTSAAIFRVGADYTGREDDLKAGSWLIPEGASMDRITDILTRGGANTCGTEIVWRIGVTDIEMVVRVLDPATASYVEQARFDPAVDAARPEIYETMRDRADTRHRLAFAEGVTSWQVVEGLKSVDLLAGELDEVPPEGRLAPDSYEVSAGDTRQSVIARMIEAQEAILAAAWAGRAADLPLDTAQEALILASIIEKETALAEERDRVASVFVNRLRRGMRLQTDPTVIYGLTEGRGVLGRGLRQSELRRATPWNTYVVAGLPPTPIANPGRASIEAAVDPAETGFVFFVADGSGGHAFAETLDEHNRNVARWREIEAERAGN